jgi:hypothetical protein
LSTKKKSATPRSNPRVLTLDIETAPIEAYVWDIWEQNVGLDQIKTEWSILAYCGKWLGSDELIYQDTGGRGPRKVRDDSRLLTGLHALLDDADIVVAQNGKKFDLRKINARLIMAGYKPYSPVRIIDTMLEARKVAAVTSTRLAWLSKYLTDTPKSEHKKFPGFELWLECLADNPVAWREMRKYNQIDVLSTEKTYLKLRPWMTTHPNMGAYHEGEACKNCGSTKLQSRGTVTTQQGKYQRFHCQECGAWPRGKVNLLSKTTRAGLLA